MLFNFMVVPDGMGAANPRPVFHMRLADDLSGRPPLCLLDTGSLDTFMARELADEAGIDLTDVEDRDPFPLGGTEVTGLPKVVDCVIEDGTGAAITLKDIRVVFTSPWDHPGFGAVLGTIAMRQIHVTISAGQGWIEIREPEAGTRSEHEECAPPLQLRATPVNLDRAHLKRDHHLSHSI